MPNLQKKCTARRKRLSVQAQCHHIPHPSNQWYAATTPYPLAKSVHQACSEAGLADATSRGGDYLLQMQTALPALELHEPSILSKWLAEAPHLRHLDHRQD